MSCACTESSSCTGGRNEQKVLSATLCQSSIAPLNSRLAAAAAAASFRSAAGDTYRSEKKRARERPPPPSADLLQNLRCGRGRVRGGSECALALERLLLGRRHVRPLRLLREEQHRKGQGCRCENLISLRMCASLGRRDGASDSTLPFLSCTLVFARAHQRPPSLRSHRQRSLHRLH